MRRTRRAQLFSAIIGVAVLTGGAAWAGHASAQPEQAGSLAAAGSAAVSASSAHGGRGTTGSTAAIANPIWCCDSGYPLGITVTGQAWTRSTAESARVAAIARAVADAQAQAKAAAQAAGVSLGRVLGMQVSAPYYPYPVPLGAGASRAAGPGSGPSASAPPAVSGSSGPAVDCLAGQCPIYSGLNISVTITMTWAIS